MPRPLCFMVMPYGRKPTQAQAGKGPAEVDFNALRDLAYVPVIMGLGHEPVRADQDSGAMIITQMLERLYFADLVLADMTIPSGNVYYEAAFDAGDADKAEELADAIADEGPARWQIDSVRSGLDIAILHVEDAQTRERSRAVIAMIDRLRA